MQLSGVQFMLVEEIGTWSTMEPTEQLHVLVCKETSLGNGTCPVGHPRSEIGNELRGACWEAHSSGLPSQGIPPRTRHHLRVYVGAAQYSYCKRNAG